MSKMYISFLVCSLLFTLTASAQSKFVRVDTIPVRHGAQDLLNPWAGGINSPMISEIDLNGDGLHDIIVFDIHDNRLLPFINDGSSGVQAWRYDPSYIPKFPPVNKWLMFYDYNCDGKKDMFTLSTSPPSGITAYRNDYTVSGGLQFTMVSPFLQETFATITTNIFASGVSIPTFVDIDNDGDMDILGYNSVPDGRIVFHRNLSMDLYGHCDSLKYEYRTGCFGNFTLRIGSTNSVSCFHCPCREAPPTLPREIENPMNYDPSDAARRDDTISSVFAIDLDGDGDKELLIGDISSDNTLMIRNGGSPTAAEMDSQDTAYPSSDVSALFNGFHFHAYIDVDNDGKKDLLVFASEFENRRGIWWYKNSGTNNFPDFHYQSDGFLQSQMIDAGENAAAVLFDYDGDGLLDLIVAGSVFQNAAFQYKNSLFVYRNRGTAQSPAFEFLTDDMASISLAGYSSPLYPAFADMDGDGDLDMLLGLENGTLQYYNNSAGPGNTASFQLAIPNYMGIDIGNAASPQIFDLNRDGKKDLIIGEKNGFVNYFENTGTAINPFFSSVPTEDTLGCIVRQMGFSPDGFTIPFAYDSSGKTRLLVSNLSGNIFQYTNIDGNLNSCFTLSDSILPYPESFRIKTNLSVSGGDLNGDGLIDLVVGMASGGVQIYMQRDPTLSVEFPDINHSRVEAFPNPAAGKFILRFYEFPMNAAILISVYNSLGVEVMQFKTSEAEAEIRTDKFSKGIYHVRITSGNRKFVKKMLISR